MLWVVLKKTHLIALLTFIPYPCVFSFYKSRWNWRVCCSQLILPSNSDLNFPWFYRIVVLGTNKKNHLVFHLFSLLVQSHDIKQSKRRVFEKITFFWQLINWEIRGQIFHSVHRHQFSSFFFSSVFPFLRRKKFDSKTVSIHW